MGSKLPNPLKGNRFITPWWHPRGIGQSIVGMKSPLSFRLSALLFQCCVASSAVLPAAKASDQNLPSDEITAVSSKVFHGYQRTRRADGSFRPENYGFAIGGFLSRIPTGLDEAPPTNTTDRTIDNISFAAIAQMIEGPLAAQQYVATPEPEKADLLIVVFWGRTIGTDAFAQSETSQVMLGSDQDKIDAENARLLGFDSARVFDQGFSDPSNMMSNIRKQLYSGVVDAIKEDRYFIILQAFDFQAAWKQKKIILLWETRFSMTQRGHDFGKDLPRMSLVAGQYFGQESEGLVYKPIPNGQVQIGNLKSFGEVHEKPDTDTQTTPAKP
jgi:hypothetical protein